MGSFATVANGRECWCAGARVPRHRHDRAYAAVVLSGAYEECGSRGRFRVSAGDVLLHEAFDAHLDRFQSQGAQILNLAVSDLPRWSLARVRDPDAIARAAEHDVIEAGALLRAALEPVAEAAQDWPDELASDLLRDPSRRLDDWAASHRLAAETISRGFIRLFGVSPAAFRAEARAACAFRAITQGSSSLAAIAADTGFADQAHMSRAVRSLTGAPPVRWRRSNPFKTAVAIAA